MTIRSEIIADSVSPAGARLTTFSLYYPRFIHSELMTHRAFSRNSASSRAIPTKRMIELIRNDIAMPIKWHVNQSGMQGNVEMSQPDVLRMQGLWVSAAYSAIATVENMISNPELAPQKQTVNRLLEPFMHMTTLVTATDFSNFFALRNHKDAQPEFQILAAQMQELLRNNKPKQCDVNDWHLPFIDNQDIDVILKWVMDRPETPKGFTTFDEVEALVTVIAAKCSAARCARVSYLNHDGTRPLIYADLHTYSRLVKGDVVHASPLEHVAFADKMLSRDSDGHPIWEHGDHRNFYGWCQYRTTHEGETVREDRP